MDKEITLKALFEGGRDIMNFSLRELAWSIGLSNTSLNDLENGKVQKPDIEVLRKIAEELDLSLEQLLKAAGYGQFTTLLSTDEFKNKSSRDLKNIIKESRVIKYDILDWDSNKRNITRNVMANLERITHKLELIRDDRGINYTLDNAIEEAEKCDEKIIRVSFRREEKNHRAIIKIENTYTNKDVNIDDIFKKGFSGKENHSGIGLWEVRKYVKNRKNSDLFTSKNDKFFSQELTIYDTK